MAIKTVIAIIIINEQLWRALLHVHVTVSTVTNLGMLAPESEYWILAIGIRLCVAHKIGSLLCMQIKEGTSLGNNLQWMLPIPTRILECDVGISSIYSVIII